MAAECLGHIRRKIRLREGNAKYRHLKKLTCKGTLRQVFIRVNRQEIQSVMLILLEHQTGEGASDR